MQSDGTIVAGHAGASPAARSSGIGQAEGERMLLDGGRFKLTSSGIRFQVTDSDQRELPWGNVRWISAGIGRDWGRITVSAVANLLVVTLVLWCIHLVTGDRSGILATLSSPEFWSEFNQDHSTLIIYAVLAIIVPGCVIAQELFRTGAREGWMEISTRGGVLLEGLLYDVPEKKMFRKAKGEPVRFTIDAKHVGALLGFLGDGRQARRSSFGWWLLWTVFGHKGRSRNLV